MEIKIREFKHKKTISLDIKNSLKNSLSFLSFCELFVIIKLKKKEKIGSKNKQTYYKS